MSELALAAAHESVDLSQDVDSNFHFNVGGDSARARPPRRARPPSSVSTIARAISFVNASVLQQQREKGGLPCMLVLTRRGARAVQTT
jgi:hypothetical protein